MKTIKSNKTSIPQLGFGLWKIGEDKAVEAVNSALEVGYRHFDTAQIYGNEHLLGEALDSSGVDRGELYVTTKIWNDNMFWDELAESLDESLDKLQTSYVDLLLLHFPVTNLRRPAWRRLEQLSDSGKFKDYGVSNYTVKHLEELLSECSVKPAVNQVELHVFLQQPELVKFCRDNGIAIEAYSPLAHGQAFGNETIAKIAAEHDKTEAQVMLRWAIQMDFITLVKSQTPERIAENFGIFDFELTPDNMSSIEPLDDNLRTCWDPTNVT